MNPTSPKFSPASLHRRKMKIARMIGARRFKYGAPTTPLLRWKLEDKLESVDTRDPDGLQFPARKLAAGLWQFHYKEISDGGVIVRKRGTHIRRRPQGEVPHDHRHNRNGRAVAEHRIQSRRCFTPPNNGIHRKAVPAKWDAEMPETKLVEQQPITAASVVSNLKAELVLAQKRINKLESRQQYSKKKVEHLRGKLEEDRALWRSQGDPKLGVVVNELDQERKTRHKIEIINSSLVKELADAKLYARKFKHEYEREKKSRELTEEVCAELAKQIVEDKAKVDALKVESTRLCEELEEERKMLQMAEVWREERIQMKLVDAKLALEDKYVQMNKLITDLETFLVSRSEKLDVMELKRAELIQQTAKSVKIKDVDQDLFYEPGTHNLMLSLLEDLKQASNFKEIEQCIGFTHDSQADSTLHNSSFRLDSFDQSPECNRKTTSDKKTVRIEAENTSSYQEHQTGCLEGISEEKINCNGSPCEDSANGVSEITEEKMRDENSRMIKGGESMSQRRWPQETVNPRFRRGAQGCIEWPRGIQRNCFKTKPLDARIESQKSQLRHVLKHRVK